MSKYLLSLASYCTRFDADYEEVKNKKIRKPYLDM